MPKSKLVIFSVLVIAITITFAVIINNAFNSHRTYTILTLDEYGVCFMVSSELTYQITPNGFKYSGKKNYGEFKISNSGFMEGANRVNINGFDAAYKKQKNLRIYQYLLDKSGVILTDDFVYVKKSPLNLVPYRSECADIKKNYTNQIPLELEIL